MARADLWRSADRMAGEMARRDRIAQFGAHQTPVAVLYEAWQRARHRQMLLEAMKDQGAIEVVQ